MNKIRVAGWILALVHLLSICGGAAAWDDDELEVFDVVEEVDRNFYELMGIPQNANASAIRGAFRKLSLQLHPDKNSAHDADVQFRNLVAVYDVLKDPGKRERYNRVLVDGLPNWRSAVYYYRRVRKMGLLEMSVILFIVITIGQYLVAWAAYFERRYNYEQVWGSKLQKMQKKNRKGKMGDVPDLADILEKIPSPSVKNTLPFQLPRWTYASAVGIPSAVRAISYSLEERRRRKKQEEEQERRRILALEQEESESEPVGRAARRRRPGFAPQQYSAAGEPSSPAAASPADLSKRETFRGNNNHAYERPKVGGGGLWTDDDILELIKLVKKYPGGTADRWEKIGETMSRTVGEVTHMAKKVKDEGLKPGQPSDSEQLPLEDHQPMKKMKTRAAEEEEEEEDITGTSGGLGCSSCSDWSQRQQRALETALAKYPKAGTLLDRWEKIASCVEGKTKEECQLRYRQLVRLVKKKNQP